MSYNTIFVIKEDESKILYGPDAGASYVWQGPSFINGITQQNPTINGLMIDGDSDIIVTCKYDCVENGNFEDGNVGFESDYTYFTSTTGNMEAGYIKIVNNWNQVHALLNGPDGSQGMFLAVNGNISQPYIDIWRKSIKCIPNTVYTISFTAAAAYWSGHESVAAPADLRIFIDGIQIGQLIVDQYQWKTFSCEYNCSNKTNITVSIKNYELENGGNDFAIDSVKIIGDYKVKIEKTKYDYTPSQSIPNIIPQVTAISHDYCTVDARITDTQTNEVTVTAQLTSSMARFDGWYFDRDYTMLASNNMLYSFSPTQETVLFSKTSIVCQLYQKHYGVWRKIKNVSKNYNGEYVLQYNIQQLFNPEKFIINGGEI